MIFQLVLLLFLFSCTGNRHSKISNKVSEQTLSVEALPIQAVLNIQNGHQVLQGPSVLIQKDRFIWGASVIKGDDNRYHMFFSTWECGPDSLTFTQSWVLNSEIGYAVSDYPDRDFQIQKVFLKGRQYEGDSTSWDAQMVHNPHIQRFDGKYFLYYIGSKDPGQPAPDAPGHKLSKRDRVQQNQKIGVLVFDNFQDIMNGNYQRSIEPLLTPRTRVKPDQVLNPSPPGTRVKPDNLIVTNRPSDSKYLLYFKGNWYTPNWRGIHGVAISDSPRGPFRARDEVMFDIKMEDKLTVSTEDPYVWYHPEHQQFYAVVKDFPGKICGEKYGLALLQSSDGLEWDPAPVPKFMKRVVPLDNGMVIRATRLERPQLLIDASGFPQVFYGACSIENANTKVNGGTFNVAIPLGI